LERIRGRGGGGPYKGKRWAYAKNPLERQAPGAVHPTVEGQVKENGEWKETCRGQSRPYLREASNGEPEQTGELRKRKVHPAYCQEKGHKVPDPTEGKPRNKPFKEMVTRRAVDPVVSSFGGECGLHEELKRKSNDEILTLAKKAMEGKKTPTKLPKIGSLPKSRCAEETESNGRGPTKNQGPTGLEAEGWEPCSELRGGGGG